jgi:hypothetical protein
MTLKGNQYEIPVLQKGYPVRTMDADGSWSLTFVYHVANDIADNFMPTQHDVDPRMGKKFLGGSIADNAAATGVAVMTLNFGDPDTSGGSGSELDGTLTYESDCGFEERPIEEHPDYKTASATRKKELRDEHGNSFIYIPIVFRKSYVLDPSRIEMAESTILRGVGKIQKPGGLKNATEGLWMKTARRIRKNRNNFEIIDEWTYDEDGWKKKLHCNNIPEG